MLSRRALLEAGAAGVAWLALGGWSLPVWHKGHPRPHPSPSPTPSPTPRATPMPTQSVTPSVRPSLDVSFGILGNDGTHYAVERADGVTTKMLELGWDQYQPSEGTFSASYVATKQAELAAMRGAGFNVILSLGVHYEPTWLRNKGSLFKDQFGDQFTSGNIGDQQVDMVFDSSMRAYQLTYIDRVLADFNAGIDVVRLGGGRFGELTYPPNSWNSHSNAYWAYSAAAAALNPVPGWNPGDASPSGQASTFVNWYLDALTSYMNWQIANVRARYGGPLMMLFPSFGVRPGQLAGAIAVNLNGSTSVEVNGELQRGYDIARHVPAIADPKVWVYCTWLDCTSGNDASSQPGDFNPVGYLSYLAQANPLRLTTHGENAGQNTQPQMAFCQSQVRKFGLRGMMWFQESELFGGVYATMADYATVIANH